MTHPTESRSQPKDEGRPVPPHRSGGGMPAPQPSSEKVLRDLLERECQDGDKLAEALGVPRTDGGFLNVPKMLAKIAALRSEMASIGPGLRVVLREYDQIAARLEGHPDGDEADFVMRAADYKVIRATLAKLPVEIVNPPKGWTP